jgi:putative hydrolase of the HAD superfamily
LELHYSAKGCFLIRHIFFDLGLTLVDNDFPEILHYSLAKHGGKYSLQEVRLAYHLANKHYMREHKGILGKNVEGYLHGYLNTMMRFLAYCPDTYDLVGKIETNFQSFAWKPYKWTIPTLKTLKEQGLSLGLISNWNHSCRSVLDSNGLTAFLDPLVISSEVQMEKPDKSIFEFALQAKGWKVEECLYVGDNYYDDVLGAEKVRMACCLVNPYEKFGIEELEHPFIVSSIAEIPFLLEEGFFDKK